MSCIIIRLSVSDSLQWRHNERDGVSSHRHLDWLLNRLFRRRSKKTSKLGVTGLCWGNPPVTDGFLSQRASNAENASIWWHHYVIQCHHISTDSNFTGHSTVFSIHNKNTKIVCAKKSPMVSPAGMVTWRGFSFQGTHISKIRMKVQFIFRKMILTIMSAKWRQLYSSHSMLKQSLPVSIFNASPGAVNP